MTSRNTHHCTTTTTSKNMIKIVKTKLNLLLLRIKLRPLEWQARMFTLVLQRPLEHNNYTHHCTSATTSENILFVNTQDFINNFFRKSNLVLIFVKLPLLGIEPKLLAWQVHRCLISSFVKTTEVKLKSSLLEIEPRFTAVQFWIPFKLPKK